MDGGRGLRGIVGRMEVETNSTLFKNLASYKPLLYRELDQTLCRGGLPWPTKTLVYVRRILRCWGYLLMSLMRNYELWLSFEAKEEYQ